MGDAIHFLGMGILALVAFVAVAISNRFKIPHPILLILAGFGLQHLTFGGQPLINPPKLMLVGFAIFALAVIAFDNASRLNFGRKKEEDKLAWSLAIKSILLHIILLTPIIMVLFFMDDMHVYVQWILGGMLALLVAETSLDTVSEHPKHIRKGFYRLSVKESIINTPIILLLVFFLLEFLTVFQFNFRFLAAGINQLLYAFIMGIAVSLVIGIVLFKYIRDKLSKHTGPPLLIIGVLAAFVVSEKLDGSGLVTVVFLGFIFGKIFVDHKAMLEEFSTTMATLIEVVVFTLIGFVLSFQFDLQFICATALFYGFMIAVRFLSISSTCKKFSPKEKWLMALNAPLGISVAAVALLLALTNRIPNMFIVINVLILVILISNIFHWATKKEFV